MPDYIYFRSLWWKKGNIHPEAKWEEATLPYMLAEGVTLNKYERRTDEFNIHGLWEWTNYKVLVYELPSEPHENCISVIITEINEKCNPVRRTDAKIIGFGATRTRADHSAKEADASFRPMKSEVLALTGSDGKRKPWSNIIVEVAYSESIDHIFDKVKNYWLKNLNRAHDAIVIKIDPVSENETPSRMQAWHFCSAERKTRKGELRHLAHFEFGTQDGTGNLLNILEGTCFIKINLNCLYHQAHLDVPIPQTILPDPIILDFFFVRNEILCAFKE
ncbi:hypothetical protein Glove_110g117 [Diversispora epigaea]|uniref:Uncharacterized protein n=1 Tax=Diversispora epigaea TaxID=1348612 RepID=A0A397JBV1_9GLOM|nr:hypothetical protein Glove_110g117 [Diversispora epigaea]